jgi:hypothetical protein
MSDRSHLDGEDAALYALGALDGAAKAAIDRHAAGCDDCARLLGSAERDVAVLVSAEPLHAPRATLPTRRREPRRTGLGWPAWAALAAALLLAALPATYFWRANQGMHAAMSADGQAWNRLAETSFRTTTFRGMNAGSTARVMYAPDGSWYVVLVRGASRALQVAWMHDGRRTMLGAVQPRGDVALLYLPKSHRMDRLALVDGERVVAEAQLAY